MGKFQAMHKYVAVFLALFACHYSLLTHGRKIKALTLSTDTTFKPLKTNVNVPTPSSSEKKMESPMMPKHSVASIGDTNAFRPTTPGTSPGVGHRKFAGEDEDMKAMVLVQSSNVKVYETEWSKNDISPTTPDHNPGLGHFH